VNEVLERSGFRELEERADLALENVRPCINEFSPFSRVDSVEPERPLLVDSYYGQVYDQLPLGAHAIYGETREIPEYAIDRLANHGFLRVPFRRIPRRVVRSLEELVAIVKALFDQFRRRKMTLLYRGQNIEYTLPRTGGARVAVCGSWSRRTVPAPVGVAGVGQLARGGAALEWAGHAVSP